MKYIEFKNAEGDIVKVNVSSIVGCNQSQDGKVLFVDLKILNNIHKDQLLVDFYGNKKTKEQFLAERGNLGHNSSKGGSTIFGLPIVSE